MWTDIQKRSEAKDIIKLEFERGAALKYLTGRMRYALVSARVLSIIRTQDRESVTLAAMDDLLHGVMDEVKRQMKNPDFFE